jgi:hypothetical protein
MKPYPLAALLMLYYPADVTNVGASFPSDSSVLLSWNLPNDPSVVGVTIFRERIFDNDRVVYRFELQGLQTSYLDSSVLSTRSYRYWIHTRDAQDDLSNGVWVEIIGEDDEDEHHWYCLAGSAPPPSSWPLWAGLALGAWAFSAGAGRRASTSAPR